MNSILVGQRGERIAELFFLTRGYALVERNFRGKAGEIDLIVKKENVLVFVEVKTRACVDPWNGLASIGREKKRKIRSVIKQYLCKPDCSDVTESRFDVLFVTQERVALYIEDESLF